MKWSSLFDNNSKQIYTKSVLNYNNIRKSVIFKFLLKKYINKNFNEKDTIYNNVKNYFEENEFITKISLEEKENTYFLVYMYNDVRFNFKRYVYIFIDNSINSISIDYFDIIFLFYVSSETRNEHIPILFKK